MTFINCSTAAEPMWLRVTRVCYLHCWHHCDWNCKHWLNDCVHTFNRWGCTMAWCSGWGSGLAIHRLLVDEASTKSWIGTTLDWQAKAYTTLDGPAKASEPKLPGWQRVGQFENHTKKNICKHFGKWKTSVNILASDGVKLHGSGLT